MHFLQNIFVALTIAQFFGSSTNFLSLTVSETGMVSIIKVAALYT